MRAKTRFLLADDHALFRSGLHRLLESKPGFKVIGEAASGVEAVSLVQKLSPDILLLDMSLRDLSGLEVLQRIDRNSRTRVILLAANLEPDEVSQALKLGARGVVLKSAATEAVFSSIETVLAGQYWIYEAPASDLELILKDLSEYPRQQNSPASKFNLTDRELDVLKGMVSGYKYKKIAEVLSISEHTVKKHVTSIFNKTGSSNRLELTLFVIEQGIVELQIRH